MTSVFSRHVAFVQRVENAADLDIHRVNHRGIGAARLVGDRGILVEVFLRGLIRRVRSCEGEVQEQRRFWILLVDQPNGFVPEEGRVIALLLDNLVVPVPVLDAVRLVLEMIDLADQRPVELVEPALPRPELGLGMAEMPFADQGGVVSHLFERLRQQPLVGRKAVLAARRDNRGLQPVAQGIAPRHQSGPRRGAHRLSVELEELDSGFGEAVEVRRLDVGTVEADVFPAQVVGNDVKDVRQGRLLRRRPALRPERASAAHAPVVKSRSQKPARPPCCYDGLGSSDARKGSVGVSHDDLHLCRQLRKIED